MQQEISILLNITQLLREKYNRRFTLDGKLIGDIGEVLASEYYNIDLLPEKTKKYDAIEISSNRQIQIKSTMKGYFTFPYDDLPDYFLAIKILENGQIEPIYNGPGHIIKKYIIDNKLKAFRNSYYSFTLPVIKRLDKQVAETERIKIRNV